VLLAFVLIALSLRQKKFDHLKELFDQVEIKLSVFENFSKKATHEKYLTLAKLMFENNYYLLSITYLFKALRLYATYAFYKYKIINNYAYTTQNYFKSQYLGISLEMLLQLHLK